MQQCPSCGFLLSPTSDEVLCPNCSHNIAKVTTQTVFSPMLKYLSLIKEIVLRPTNFFQKMPASGGYSNPLAFGLITHWIGSFFYYIFSVTLLPSSESMFQKFQILQFLNLQNDFVPVAKAIFSASWNLGFLILDPFFTTLYIFFNSIFIFAAARIFTTSKLNFEATIRLVCYALGPAIFAVLPGMGNILLLVWIPILLIIGAKEIYQTTSGRSILIALFPSLVLFGIIILAMLVFALGFFKIIFSFLQ